MQTENLIADIIDNCNIDGYGKIISYTAANTYRLLVAPIISGKTYTICLTGSITTIIYGIYDSLPEIGSISYDTSRHIVYAVSETFVAPITGYIAFRGNYNITTYMLIEGSTAPTTYIPYGYKIPMSLTDETSASNYDLYVGGSKLYADEYLDFESQKVYKYVDGVLTPQDPPLPFPTISTYKGENTLSSTETLGDIELTGDWLAIMGSTEDESIDIGFTVDAEEYIAFVSVDDGPSIQVSDTITMPSSASSFTLQVVSWGREQYTDTVYNALS